MDKRFWAILGVIAAIFVGILYMQNHKKADNGVTGQPTNHISGESPKNITLVEYGDYQCPYCVLFYPTFKQVAEKYSKQVIVQFRNYPLPQMHQNAFAAARAAEAAGLQNKFWEMHDALYQNQQSWEKTSTPQSLFESYAQQLGLNLVQFKADFASSKVNDLINSDVATFNKLGLKQATPTFLLNGKQIEPENSVEGFSKFIDEELAK